MPRRSKKFTCTEFAVKKLTGRDLLQETGLSPEDIGFENLKQFKVPCSIRTGTFKELPKLKGAMLRIVPQGQKERHTVILWNIKGKNATIEDQYSKRTIPLADLHLAWKKAGKRLAICKKTAPNSRKTKKKLFLVDIDDTIATMLSAEMYPLASRQLKQLQQQGHEIIFYTKRPKLLLENSTRKMVKQAGFNPRKVFFGSKKKRIRYFTRKSRLKKRNLSEAVVIDDTKEYIDYARKIGRKTIQIRKPKDWEKVK